MKFLLVPVAILLPGCSAIGALGYGPDDLMPTLQYCHEVTYTRVGTEMIMQAKCRLPTG